MTKLLVVFDVDSTLIQDEVIELLAAAAGKREEVAVITEQAMAGEIDFVESLERRVATLAGLPQSVFAEAQKRIRITNGALETIAAIHEAGGKVGAVSGGFSQLLNPLAEILNLDFARANELEVQDGFLTGKVKGRVIDSDAKAAALLEWAAACGCEKTVAVGDGANDLKMMEVARLGVAFNAKPIVREKADAIIEEMDLRKLLDLIGL